MPPKKPAAGPAAAPSQSSDDAPSKEKKSDAPSARKSAAHPSTVIMVKEALKALDSRKGVSSKAMQNYIKQKYPSVDVLRLKHLVRRALKKGIESGTLVRPANSNVSTGATGKFRLAPKVKEPKSKSENADPNVQKEAKENDVVKKPPKTGAAKNEATKEGGKPQEDSKSPKRSKKDQAGTSKVAPVKKPKGKKVAENGNGKDTSASVRTTKEPKAGKETRHKVAKKGSDAPAAITTRKGGKKAAE